MKGDNSILVTTTSVVNVLATSKHITRSHQLQMQDSGLIDYKIFLEMHCNPISGSDISRSSWEATPITTQFVEGIVLWVSLAVCDFWF